MELLDLPQLAGRSGIPVSLARYYRDRFVLFVPTVRIGRTLLHPPEAVEVLARIHALAGDGASADAVIQALEAVSPVAVISARPLRGTPSTGAAGVMNALAATLDERGARIERELAAIRQLAAQPPAAVQAPAPVEEAVGAIRAELDQLRTGIDHLQAQTGQLASRDQLEWIGDVVSAALIRLPKPNPEPALEQRLEDLLHEVQRPRPSSDVVELRVAVERLTDYVHHRDAELRRSFQTLVTALRSEIQGLRAGLGELRPSPPARPSRPNGAVDFFYEADEPVTEIDEPVVDPPPPRPPRRLGHPVRPVDGLRSDGGHAHGAASP